MFYYIALGLENINLLHFTSLRDQNNLSFTPPPKKFLSMKIKNSTNIYFFKICHMIFEPTY